MKVLKFFVLFILFIGLFSIILEGKRKWPVLKGPYLGQKPPGMRPEIFAPGIVSTDKSEFNSVFSPDGNEFYFSRDDPNRKKSSIMYMKRVNNIWTKPEVAPFSGIYDDFDMSISYDGYRFFFCSKDRPFPGSSTPSKGQYIWYMRKTKNSWDKPQPLYCADNMPLRAIYPTLTYNGALYFQARFEGIIGKSDIYRSRFVNGSYNTPENLGSAINSPNPEGDVLISPDESFMIVSCYERPDTFGKGDLYISFHKKDGSWTTLQNLGKNINTKYSEFCPMLSPDREFFFFSRNKNHACDVYWVDAKIIEELKLKELK